MAERKFQTSFSAGELSPALFARVDLDKYGSGAALLRNFFVDYRGGASSRPGTAFVGPAYSNTTGQPRLIPFIVSTIGAYVLEFGHNYIRFIANGAYIIDIGTGQPLRISSPYAAQDLPLLSFTQSANVLTLTHHSYPVYNLTRLTSTTFSLDQGIIGPRILSPGAAPSCLQSNPQDNKSRYGYCITAVNSAGDESLPSGIENCDGSILNQNTSTYNTIQWPAVADAVRYNIYKEGPTATGGGTPADATPMSSNYGFIGSSTTTSFVDNNIAPDYSITPPTFTDPFSPGQIAEIQFTPGSGYAGAIRYLVITGDGTDAAGYIIIDPATTSVVGVVITNPGKGYTFANITDSDANTATYTAILGQQSGTYPAACGYYQQRRVFGGTDNFPESMVMSQTGLYNNFDVHLISQDSDSITASLASRQVNAIKSLTAMPTGLIVLTTGGGFLVSGGGPEAAVTPSSISALPQASSGCNDLPPLIINYDLLYAQNRGFVVRDLAFNFYVQSYTGTDRSVLASHLFTNYTGQEWTYAEEPFRLIQIVRSDGTLLNFTYVPEQEIFAWTHSDTNGLFRSIASIPEGNTNAVYVVVQRLVGGAWQYYVERFADRLESTPEDAWCLDCALATENVEPQTGLMLGSATVLGTATTNDPLFTALDVGKTIWAGGGQAVITTYISPTQVSYDVIKSFPLLPDDPSLTPLPFFAGEWQLNPNVTQVTGLDHLNGLTVAALADGIPVPPSVLINGTFNLPQPSSKVVVGLPFTAQLQTLRIDTGEPTSAGKRKMIPAVTARIYNTLNLKVGPNFSQLTTMRETISPYPPRLISIDVRQQIVAGWTKDGQICFQQDLPLPVTILGVIPEVVLGDTGH